MNKIKQLLKNIISSVLIITVLLPFAVQFIHILDHHHEHVCLATDLHIDSHEQDCSVFHFKIDQNSIFFPIKFEFIQKPIFNFKIATIEYILKKVQINKKSSRAPPSSFIL